MGEIELVELFAKLGRSHSTMVPNHSDEKSDDDRSSTPRCAASTLLDLRVLTLCWMAGAETRQPAHCYG